jgi:DNA anti-recombination protein RmuC
MILESLLENSDLTKGREYKMQDFYGIVQAIEKRFLLVSPTNLFAVLKIICDLWKMERQNKHALHIAD